MVDLKKLEHLYEGSILSWDDINKYQTDIPVLEEIKRGSGKPCVFAPFMGEFGFFINTYIRFIHYFNCPQKMVCCRPGEEIFFPSAHDFVYDWNDFQEDKDRLGANIPGGKKEYQELKNELKRRFPQHELLEVGHEISYRFIQFMPIPLNPFCSDIDVDIVIGPRNRPRDLQRNFSKESWNIILNNFKDYKIGIIGQPDTSYDFPQATVRSWDFERPADAMVKMLQKCKVFIGTDTGTSHVASMCGCPMVIFRKQDWSTDFVPFMKQQNKNLVFVEGGWDNINSIIKQSEQVLTKKYDFQKDDKVKVCLHIPLHVSNHNHAKMLLEKKKLFKNLRALNVDTIFTIDKDDVGVDLKDIPHIKLEQASGIVKPTKEAISYFKSRYGDNCFMMRTGQDIQINIEGLYKHLEWLSSKSTEDLFLAGDFARHNDIFEVLKEIDIYENPRMISFIQGNFMSSPIKVWDKYYNNLPSSVTHYKDDSIMSFCLERDGGRLEKINKFWNHEPKEYFDKFLLKGKTIEQMYNEVKNQPSDVKDLLPIYEKYANQVESIVEFRDDQYISTLAFLSGNPKKMRVYNYNPCLLSEDIKLSKKNTDLKFLHQDSLNVEIEYCDLLHLDTFHNYDRVLDELRKHESKVSKFIIIHDTNTFGEKGDDHSVPGVKRAIVDFLSQHNEWILNEEYNQSNGMIILKRKGATELKLEVAPKVKFTNDNIGRKIIFYHLLCENNYISIHNRMMAKFLSNPFFDDAEFYISVVGDLSDRLLMPKNLHINKFENMGSEAPAFINMKNILTDMSLQSNDIVGYFHCKGASKKNLRKSNEVHDQDSMESFFGIEMWSNLMMFFLVDHIQEYIQYIQKYGSACVYPVRHLYGEQKKAGSLGNFWWCAGDVAKAICKITNVVQKDRHYYEHTVLHDMLNASSRIYKSAFYVHDGRLDIYKYDNNAIEDCINGYFSNDKLIELINMDLPYNNDYPAVGIRITDPSNEFYQIADRFLQTQRFQNVWVGANLLSEIKNNERIITNGEYICPLVLIEMTELQMKNNMNYYYIDNLVKKYKNSKNTYDLSMKKYCFGEIQGVKIIPTKRLIFDV